MRKVLLVLALVSAAVSHAAGYTKVSGWGEVNVQAIRGDAPPTAHSGDHYLDLTINNDYDKDEAYVTQTFPIIEAAFHRFYVRAYRPADVTGTFPYFEFSDDAGGSVERWVNITESGSWVENWWNYDSFMGVGATEVTMKIKVSRAGTTGTRHFYVDNLGFVGFDDVANPDFEMIQSMAITQTGGSTDVSEAGPTSDTYTMVLTEGEPTANVMVTVDPDTQTEVNSSGAGNAVEFTFTTANWNTAQTVTVIAIDDSSQEDDHTSRITHTGASSDPRYTGAIANDVIVNITDNDENIRTCYDPGVLSEPDDLVDLSDLARLAANWMEPYESQLWQSRPLAFRAMLAMIGGRFDPSFSDTTAWDNLLSQWSSEGFNALVYWFGNEVFNGAHAYLYIEEYPEARQTSSQQITTNMNRLKWIFAQAKTYGINNFLYTLEEYHTQAFADAHGLGQTSGVRTPLTRAYRESMFAEMSRTYTDLDGYYGDMGEALPGKRSSWFREAIAPGLNCTGGRETQAPKPLFICIQWQIPIEDYLEDVAPKDVYDNTWLGLHGYNSEQISDAEPWPYAINWAKKVGLPTVVELYPTNIYNFPFNSPEFAYEIISELKLIANIKGFLYMEWTGRKLSPLFRKALAYYGSNSQEYSDETWLDILEVQFGNRTAAEYFLDAYKISGQLIPEKDALVYCGHGPAGHGGRELQISYELFKTDWKPFSYLTSKLRGRPLVPVWNYAQWVAQSPSYYQDKDGTEDTGWQNSIWRSEGGSEFDIIPPHHMSKIADMGQQCFDKAELGKAAATPGEPYQTEAQNAWMFMKGYKLLSTYYQSKVNAATAAYLAHYTGLEADRNSAQTSANNAYNDWLAFYNFVVTENPNLNAVMQSIYGTDVQELMSGGGKTMQTLLDEEVYDRDNLSTIFDW